MSKNKELHGNCKWQWVGDKKPNSWRLILKEDHNFRFYSRISAKDCIV